MRMIVLQRVALGVGVTGVVGSFIAFDLIQSRIRKKPYFDEALKLMKQYAPIQKQYFRDLEVRPGNVNLADLKTNKITPTAAQVSLLGINQLSKSHSIIVSSS